MNNRVEEFKNRDDFHRLLAILRWFAAMPHTLYVGTGFERFRADMKERFYLELPIIPEVDDVWEKYRIEAITANHNDEVAVTVHHWNSGEYSHTITFV